MKLKLFYISCFLCMSSSTYAGAWLIEKGKRFESQGIFYNFPYKYSEKGSFEDSYQTKLNYNIENHLHKVGYTNFLEYGLTQKINLAMKVDFEQVRDRINITTRDKNSEANSLSVQTGYGKLISEFDIKKVLISKGRYILSGSLKLSPGALTFFGNQIIHSYQTVAGGIALNYGYSFESLKNSYLDSTLIYRHYPYNSHRQVDFNIIFGIRPHKKILMQIGLYNTFNGLNYNLRPYSRKEFENAYKTFKISDENRVSLIDTVNSSLKVSTPFQYHQLALKCGYEFKKNKMINFKFFSNIFNSQPFKYNTFIITYDVKF